MGGQYTQFLFAYKHNSLKNYYKPEAFDRSSYQPASQKIFLYPINPVNSGGFYCLANNLHLPIIENVS